MFDEATLLLLLVLVLLIFLTIVLSLRRNREIEEESYISKFLKAHHLRDKNAVAFVEKNFKKESILVDSLFFVIGLILFLFGLFRSSILFVFFGFIVMVLCLYLLRQLLKIEKQHLFSDLPASQKINDETRHKDRGA